jgi:hypothetical protein
MKLSGLHYIQLLDETRQEIYSHGTHAVYYLKEIQDRLEQGVVDAEIIKRVKKSLGEMNENK